MCLTISFGTFVMGNWMPNPVKASTFLDILREFNPKEDGANKDMKDILNKFNVYYTARRYGGQINSFSGIVHANNNLFFYPKKQTNFGYKYFGDITKNSVVCNTYYSELYFNKWHTAENDEVEIGDATYMSGFHIFSRLLDLNKYFPYAVKSRIRRVEYKDVMHYGLDSNCTVVVIANKIKVLK